MAKDSKEILWTLKPGSLQISNPPTYSFGFTGFKMTESDWLEEEEMDEFEQFVRETRKANGIIDPEPEIIFKQSNSNIPSQILFSGSITVPTPKFHAQLKGIIADGSTGSDNDSD